VLEAAVDRISVRWRIDREELVVVAHLPTGTVGVLELPGCDPVEVGSGRHQHRTRLVAGAFHPPHQ